MGALLYRAYEFHPPLHTFRKLLEVLSGDLVSHSYGYSTMGQCIMLSPLYSLHHTLIVLDT